MKPYGVVVLAVNLFAAAALAQNAPTEALRLEIEGLQVDTSD